MAHNERLGPQRSLRFEDAPCTDALRFAPRLVRPNKLGDPAWVVRIHGSLPWKDIGKPMPFALALGVEPIIPFVCGMPYPPHMDEADLAGAYYGEAIETARCVTVPLEAPVSAEIVVGLSLER